MAIWHNLPKRKPTGGKPSVSKKKTRSQLGSVPTETKIDETRRQARRMSGGDMKQTLSASNVANVADRAAKKIRVAKITSVAENAANLHYVRRNIITRGAVIETDIGRARVTSRPGQDGVVNAVLLEEKKAK